MSFMSSAIILIHGLCIFLKKDCILEAAFFSDYFLA